MEDEGEHQGEGVDEVWWSLGWWLVSGSFSLFILAIILKLIHRYLF